MPIAAAEYDPATGTTSRRTGVTYTQANLAQTATEGEDMAVDAAAAGKLTAPADRSNDEEERRHARSDRFGTARR